MTYQELKDKLVSFGYTYNIHSAGKPSKEFIHWRFRDIRNGELFEASVDYIVDEYGVIRQQFGKTPNVVRFHVYDRNTSGYWSEHSFEECVELIIKGEFVRVDVMRNYKLEKLGI